MDRRRWIVIVFLCAALTACDGGQGASSRKPQRSPMDALLEQYPPCSEPSPGRASSGIRGLLLPEGSVVYSVRRQGPITTVQGFVPMTPVDVREHYESDPAIQIIVSEDEFVESELLFSNGDFRNFVKARASCREGSDIVTVISRELSGLPTPAGTGAPSEAPSTTPAP